MTATLPVPVARQFGDSPLLGPTMVADMQVLTGASNPQGLVNIVAVTAVPLGIVLSQIFSTNPTIVASTGNMTVLVTNNGAEDDVSKPIHPPSLTD